MKTLDKNEKDLKVIAEYFVEHEGCRKIDCNDCPLDNGKKEWSCKINDGNDDNYPASIFTYQWARIALAQLKKLDYLEKLT
jgi:hypothetical protein